MSTGALKGVRALVVHEWLYTWAGAERCLSEILDLLPGADLLVGFATPEAKAQYAIAQRAVETWVSRLPGSQRHHRWFLPLHALAFSQVDTSRYDLVVSLSHAAGKFVRGRPRGGGTHVCYCLSPPRYLWDLHRTYLRHGSIAQRVALSALVGPLRAVDRWGASGVDEFVSISRTVADRVRRTYGRESDVVYPPVSPKPGAVTERGEPFLLSVGRLVPYKRIDLAIQAAERMQLKLVIAGAGPERERLERLASGGKYTEFLGEVSEAEAGRLLSTCAAFVFCGEEDFGIAPVEANAHGTPVVGYARGGLLETMVSGETAVFFEEQTMDAVTRAIERCLASDWDGARLRANAERFSRERYRDRMQQVLTRALQRQAVT